METELLITALAGALLLSVVLQVIHVLRSRGLKQRLHDVESRYQELDNNLNALCSGSVGIGKRISRLESRTREQAQRQTRLEHKEPDLQNYGNAARLANKGADLDELMDHCGLSRGEAELILFLNSQQSAQTH